jgi:hypothetical protein
LRAIIESKHTKSDFYPSCLEDKEEWIFQLDNPSVDILQEQEHDCQLFQSLVRQYQQSKNNPIPVFRLVGQKGTIIVENGNDEEVEDDGVLVDTSPETDQTTSSPSGQEQSSTATTNHPPPPTDRTLMATPPSAPRGAVQRQRHQSPSMTLESRRSGSTPGSGSTARSLLSTAIPPSTTPPIPPLPTMQTKGGVEYGRPAAAASRREVAPPPRPLPPSCKPPLSKQLQRGSNPLRTPTQTNWYTPPPPSQQQAQTMTRRKLRSNSGGSASDDNWTNLG